MESATRTTQPGSKWEPGSRAFTRSTCTKSPLHQFLRPMCENAPDISCAAHYFGRGWVDAVNDADMNEKHEGTA
ncbi:hypothetical protein [Propionimicrobium sp. PCR01-08-3]|uniref:hypothetical protein n=1 Tax=Propionimicrobium sp. PCR01-08-3 TaxID=3052086 RepID=UPI00255CD044|nr:hypothetical protein [Propionimicrobium sp. PCR01-08-3]WIY82254.1 hypothetical protein QQ658_12225 [Propionimicrobium sp. PCR01-08-3]